MNNPTAISLVVSCDPDLARLVRMTAANVATLSTLSVECVEDIRMAAAEAFIYACATSPDETLTIDFDVDSTRVAMPACRRRIRQGPKVAQPRPQGRSPQGRQARARAR